MLDNALTTLSPNLLNKPASKLDQFNAQQASSLTPKEKMEAKARAAAEDFEAVFLTQMLTPVFEQLPTDGLTGGGQGEKIYRSLIVQEYGKALSKNGGIGIADSVYKDILKLQEV